MNNGEPKLETVVHGLKRFTRHSDFIYKLNRRADFLALAKQRKAQVSGLNLQGRSRENEKNIPKSIIRVGFTCSRKVGNAVYRNKAKRKRQRGLIRETRRTTTNVKE